MELPILKEAVHADDSVGSCCQDFRNLLLGRLIGGNGHGTHLAFRRDQTIYRPGDPANALFQIVSGRVKVIGTSTQGQEKILSLLEPGEIFGELCLCESRERTDEAVALEDVRLTAYSMEGIWQLIGESPEFARDLLRFVCARLAACREGLLTLSFDSVAVRLAKELLRLAQSPGSVSDQGGKRLGVSLSHEELAALVGTAREVVTVVMNHFRQKQLVDYRRRAIVVFPERIEAFLARSTR